MSAALERIEALAALAAPRAGRPGLGCEEQAACELAAGWMERAGLEIEWDAFGNVVGRLVGSRPELPEVWTGSHLDTVPDGGKFDGVLGVVAAIEAIERLVESHRPVASVCAVVFRDEEGWRFGRGCFGSRALVGAVAAEELDAADANGMTVRDALTALGFPAPANPPRGRLPGVFIETHIEQGPRLERAGAPLGIVTGIVGMLGYELVFAGDRGHAGTVPMAGRADALVAAARFVLAASGLAGEIDGATATVGVLEVESAASNVIPGVTRLAVDARAPDVARLDAIDAALSSAAANSAARGGCTSRQSRAWRLEPVSMAGDVRAALRQAASGAGFPALELPAGAGHDAGVLAHAGVRAGMLFVRSLDGGVSHSPRERTDPEAVRAAVDVLAETVASLAGHGS